MDVWALNLKSGGLVLGSRTVDKGINGFGSKLVSEVRIKRVSFGYRALVVTATSKKKNHDNPSSSGNNDPLVPEGDGPEGADPVYDKSKSGKSSPRSHNPFFDKRDFRANLVARGHELLDPSRLIGANTSPQEAVSKAVGTSQMWTQGKQTLADNSNGPSHRYGCMGCAGINKRIPKIGWLTRLNTSWMN